MKAVNRVWSAVGMYVQALSFLLALLCIFTFATPRADAAGLSDVQIRAVAVLAASFGATDSMVANVELALGGDPVIRPTISSTTPVIRLTLSPKAGECAPPIRSLRRGSTGEDVARLQELLKQAGYFQASTTNYFGSVTEEALKAFQANMNIATSGDPSTTGFGQTGPRSREALGRLCTGNIQPTLSGPIGSSTPTCVLHASSASVVAGNMVTLTWESKYAAYAGSASGAIMPPQGSITVNPTQTTTYVKKVYNNNGEGSCQATVEVTGSTAAPAPQIVRANIGGYLSGLLSQMQLGAVVVGETLSQVFAKTQVAAAANSTLGCTLTALATANINGRITVSWSTTGVPQVLAIYLGNNPLATNLPASGSQTIATPAFPAIYNYKMQVGDGTNTANCYTKVTVVDPSFASPLARVWPQLYGQYGSYGNDLTSAMVKDIYALGFRLNIQNSDLLNEGDMAAYGGARIDNSLMNIIYGMCDQTPDGRKGCSMTATQTVQVYAQVQSRLNDLKNDPFTVAFIDLDDYPGNIKPVLQKVHDMVTEANKTSVVVRPVICAFEGYRDIDASTAPFVNYSSTACDAVSIYEYGFSGSCFLGICVGATNAATELAKVYPKIEKVLLAGGWNKNTQPLIGTPQAFTWQQFGSLDRNTIKKETEEFCQLGASSIIFFSWNLVTGDGTEKIPYNTSWMRDGVKDGFTACTSIWKNNSADPSVVVGQDDTTSSVPTDKVTLYKDCNYAGTSVSLKEGSYDSTDLTNKGYTNNITSSLRIPAGFTATVYDGNGLSNSLTTLTGDQSCLSSSYNDKISSIKVTQGSAPSQVSSGTPANNATDLAVPVTLSWSAASGATSYVFYLAQTATSLVSYQNSSASSFSFTGAEYGKTYYWRVDAVNSKGTTQGAVWKFTTKANTTTQPPSKSGPINGVQLIPSAVPPSKVNAAPTCTLTASATRVKKNAAVTLTWTSKSATSVSGANPSLLNGSVTVTVDKDTNYTKTVYNAVGQGSCSVNIDVTSDSDGRGSTKVVVNPSPGYLLGLLHEMQLGAVVIAETLGIINSNW